MGSSGTRRCDCQACGLTGASLSSDECHDLSADADCCSVSVQYRLPAAVRPSSVPANLAGLTGVLPRYRWLLADQPMGDRSEVVGIPWRTSSKLARAGAAASMIAAAGRLCAAKQHVCSVADHPLPRIYAAASWRVRLDEVGMSGGYCHIVYDLSRSVPGHRSALHGRIANQIMSPWRSTYRQDRWGLARNLRVRHPIGADRNGREDVEGSGAYDAQARRVI